MVINLASLLLSASGVDLTNGGGIEELKQFQTYLSDYKIIVYDCLKPDRLMFTGNSLSARFFIFF
jgi:hypothetical protein